MPQALMNFLKIQKLFHGMNGFLKMGHSCKGYSLKSKLHSVPDCQSIIKKAIVEKLKNKYHCSWFDEKGPLYQIQFSLMKNKVTMMIDTSGQGLHKRGYRKKSNEAPLRETLASAMIMLSRWKNEQPFLDPFCGSGTIPIEAALIGANIAPGLDWEFVSKLASDSKSCGGMLEMKRIHL